MTRPLSDKQERFVREYLIDHNARHAGYSPNSQGSAATDLMKDPRIKQRIRQGLDDLFERLDLSAERLMMERINVAFFDPADLLDGAGKLLPLHLMGRGLRTAAHISISERGDETTIRVRSPNRNPALSALERLLTLYHGLRAEAENDQTRSRDVPEVRVSRQVRPDPVPEPQAPQPGQQAAVPQADAAVVEPEETLAEAAIDPADLLPDVDPPTLPAIPSQPHRIPIVRKWDAWGNLNPAHPDFARDFKPTPEREPPSPEVMPREEYDIIGPGRIVGAKKKRAQAMPDFIVTTHQYAETGDVFDER